MFAPILVTRFSLALRVHRVFDRRRLRHHAVGHARGTGKILVGDPLLATGIVRLAPTRNSTYLCALVPIGYCCLHDRICYLAQRQARGSVV